MTASRQPVTLPRVSLKQAALSADECRQLFSYDAETGVLTWKRPLSRRQRVGDRAGSCRPDGRWQIGVRGIVYVLPRVIWLYAYGRWPEGEVDHRDLDTSNNRLGNLRVASRGQNEANRPCRGRMGIKGVSVEKRTGRWKAAIRVGGRSTHLGMFDTAEQAGAAYRAAAAQHHGQFARV